MKSLVELCEECSKLGHSVSTRYRGGKMSSVFISCRWDIGAGIGASVKVSIFAGGISISYKPSEMDELNEKEMAALQTAISYIRGVGTAITAAMKNEWEKEINEYGVVEDDE